MRPSPYTDLDRPPLSAAALRRALVVPGALWGEIVVTAETGSTNADVAAAARAGAAEGLVVVAERQTAGRGRLDRQWTSPPRAGLAVSVLLRPRTSPRWYGWLPLLAGVALVETVRRLGEVDAVLKWPNDVLIDNRKCAGILAEAVPDAVVLGIGLNVTLKESELPRPDATSLQLAGAACTDRDPLLRTFLRTLADRYERWSAAGGDPEASGLRQAYRLHCGTLGQRVRIALPDGATLAGVASDVDGTGRLVVTGPDGAATPVAAGDVVHVR
ncbi:MAG: biotin--[acetyl-CoA-carboxylase] ligase [Actinobacteria bacterium]|nr:MAG: biotin--[acetyl-CoA-carboxylase] ligase [Actinomycetota bacterium]